MLFLPYLPPNSEMGFGKLLTRAAIVSALAITSIKAIGADVIPQGYQTIARETGVPAPLLYAVALTESGQSRLSQSHWRPWPWTLNISGRGQDFASRRAAWLALQNALGDEDASVDIGLMQVNWRYQHRDLGSPWQSLDPYHNLRVGAAILKRCHSSDVDWWKSVGCYHAPNNPVRAQHYRERVRGSWRALSTQPGAQ